MRIKYLFFDNTDVCGTFDETKAMLQDADPESVITDERVWNAVRVDEEFLWNEAMESLTKLFGERKCVCYGTIGTWRGSHDGAKIIDTVKQAVRRIVEDCDYIKIETTEEGTIMVTATHHDGTHHMEMKPLNLRGESFANKWFNDYETDMTEFEMIERIWNNKIYSHTFTDKDITKTLYK